MKVLLCGGGNAVHVFASYVGSKPDCEVSIWSMFGDEAERLQQAKNGGMCCINDLGPDVYGTPLQVSKHAKDVVPGSDVILLSLPAFAHEAYLEAMAPYIDKCGVIIGAIPAGGGFDMCVREAFGSKLADKCILFATETLPWACRIEAFAECVKVFGTKKRMDISVLPKSHTLKVIHTMNDLIGPVPHLDPDSSFLACTLMNPNSIAHPTLMYGRFRNWDGHSSFKERPLIYEGVDEYSGKKLDSVSNEVLAIKTALLKRFPNLDLASIMHIQEWFLRAYGKDVGDTSSMHRMLQTNKGYCGHGLVHPMIQVEGRKEFVPNFHDRYMTEDVPCGLVVTRGIAELLNVPTPNIDEILIWSQNHTGKEYLVEGRLCGKDLVRTRCPQRYGYTTLEAFIKGNRYEE